VQLLRRWIAASLAFGSLLGCGCSWTAKTHAGGLTETTDVVVQRGTPYQPDRAMHLSRSVTLPLTRNDALFIVKEAGYHCHDDMRLLYGRWTCNCCEIPDHTISVESTTGTIAVAHIG
jgi:hypothetical protein